jgi:D-cysteine desulfhydrase
MIPPGGSSPLGTIGFVNAAFELEGQLKLGLMPEPDRIYVALGTGGTAVGLMIGLNALGRRSKVIPIRVVSERLTKGSTLAKLYAKTVLFLRSLDSSFPEIDSASDLEVRDEFLGQGYARFTGEGREAFTTMMNSEGIKLDGTYTAKTFAAIMADAEKPDVMDEVILFWNTYNSVDL